jgi:hypothetical protein
MGTTWRALPAPLRNVTFTEQLRKSKAISARLLSNPAPATERHSDSGVGVHRRDPVDPGRGQGRLQLLDGTLDLSSVAPPDD